MANGSHREGRLALLDLEKALAVFDRLPVFSEDFENGPLCFRLDLVHDLHRLNDADDGVFDDFSPNIDERLALRGRRAVKGAHHGGFDVGNPWLFFWPAIGRSRRDGGCSGGRWVGRRCIARRERRVRPAAAGADNRQAVGSAANLQLETLFLDGEFGQFGPLHQFNDLLNLFEVQKGALVELNSLAGLIGISGRAFKRFGLRQATTEFFQNYRKSLKLPEITKNRAFLPQNR